MSLCLSVDKVPLPETWGLAEPLAWDDAEMLTGKGAKTSRTPGLFPSSQ